MVSTRLASPCTPIDFTAPDRRARVDPAKLIGLIRRIQAASGARAPTVQTKPNPVAKTGS